MQTYITFNENYFSNSFQKNFDESVKITSLYFNAAKKTFKIKAFASEKNIFEKKFGTIFFKDIKKIHKFYFKNEFQTFGEKLINGEKKHVTEMEMHFISTLKTNKLSGTELTSNEEKKDQENFQNEKRNFSKIHELFNSVLLNSFEFHEKIIPETFEISLHTEWIQENFGAFEIFSEITKNLPLNKIQTCNQDFKNLIFSLDSSGYEVVNAEIKNSEEIYDAMNLFPKTFLVKTTNEKIEEIPIFWFTLELIISFFFEQKRKERLRINVRSNELFKTEEYNLFKKTVEKIKTEFSKIYEGNQKELSSKIYEENEVFNENEINFNNFKKKKKIMRYKVINIESLKTFEKTDFQFFEKKENLNDILNVISKIFLNIVFEYIPKISFKIPIEKAMKLKINDYIKFNLMNENFDVILLKITNVEFFMKNEIQFARITTEIKNESTNSIKKLSEKFMKKIKKEDYKETPFDKNVFKPRDLINQLTIENLGNEQIKEILKNEFKDLNEIQKFINENETKILIHLLDLRNQKPIEIFLSASLEA